MCSNAGHHRQTITAKAYPPIELAIQPRALMRLTKSHFRKRSIPRKTWPAYPCEFHQLAPGPVTLIKTPSHCVLDPNPGNTHSFLTCQRRIPWTNSVPPPVVTSLPSGRDVATGSSLSTTPPSSIPTRRKQRSPATRMVFHSMRLLPASHTSATALNVCAGMSPGRPSVSIA